MKVLNINFYQLLNQFDANKRTGLMTLVFYSNKYNLTIKLNDTEMFDFIQKIAASDIDIEQLSNEVF